MNRRTISYPVLLLLLAGFIGAFALGCGSEENPVGTVLTKGGGGGGGSTCTQDELAVEIDPNYPGGAAGVAAANGWTLMSFNPSTNIGVFCGDMYSGGPGLPPSGVVEIELNSRIVGSGNNLLDFVLGIWDGETITGTASGTGFEITNAPTMFGDGRHATVAIIDTGINTNHPAFDQDNIDYPATTSEAEDVLGHGTAMAGIIVQVARRTTIIPINVLDPATAGATVNDVANAIYLARDMGADIINMSLHFTGTSTLVSNAINDVTSDGVVIFASAGNTPGSIPFPASMAAVNSVTSTDVFDQIAPGVGSVADYGAPGIDILSYGLGDNAFVDDDYFVRGTGTSMATAIASGIMALYISADRESSFDSAAQNHPTAEISVGRVDADQVMVPLLKR